MTKKGCVLFIRRQAYHTLQPQDTENISRRALAPVVPGLKDRETLGVVGVDYLAPDRQI
jgi:hypothetical protein